MESETWVQTLDEAVSLCANALKKDMNLAVLPPGMCK